MSDERVHETLTQRLVSIIKQARGQVARTVNTAMVQAYWHLGREIVESEQVGQSRAEYGEALIRSVFEALQAQFGRGFGYSTVKADEAVLPDLPERLPSSRRREKRHRVAPIAQRAERRHGVVPCQRCHNRPLSLDTELESLSSVDEDRAHAFSGVFFDRLHGCLAHAAVRWLPWRTQCCHP